MRGADRLWRRAARSPHARDSSAAALRDGLFQTEYSGICRLFRRDIFAGALPDVWGHIENVVDDLEREAEGPREGRARVCVSTRARLAPSGGNYGSARVTSDQRRRFVMRTS